MDKIKPKIHHPELFRFVIINSKSSYPYLLIFKELFRDKPRINSRDRNIDSQREGITNLRIYQH